MEAEPKIIIDKYELRTVNCPDRATARVLAEERIRGIEQRIKDIKSEKKSLNSQKHILTRWLNKINCKRAGNDSSFLKTLAKHIAAHLEKPAVLDLG